MKLGEKALASGLDQSAQRDLLDFFRTFVFLDGDDGGVGREMDEGMCAMPAFARNGVEDAHDYKATQDGVHRRQDNKPHMTSLTLAL